MLLPQFYTKQTTIIQGSSSKFIFEPLSQSFAQTLGTSYRRTLLSSIPGFAITAVKVDGVPHIFSTIAGIKESVLDIVMNLKQVRFKMDKSEKHYVSLIAKGSGKIFAKDIDSDLEIANKDLYICELTSDKAKLNIEAIVEVGYGFSPTEEREETESGFVAVDASFSPVKHVNFKVSDARVGRKSNYEKLELDLVTDGSISPEESLKQAKDILIEQFKHMFSGQDVPPTEVKEEKKEESVSPEKSKVMETIIDELNLPSRVINALLREKIETVADLMKRGKEDLVGLKGVGRKSIDLIDVELRKMDVELK